MLVANPRTAPLVVAVPCDTLLPVICRSQLPGDQPAVRRMLVNGARGGGGRSEEEDADRVGWVGQGGECWSMVGGRGRGAAWRVLVNGGGRGRVVEVGWGDSGVCWSTVVGWAGSRA